MNWLAEGFEVSTESSEALADSLDKAVSDDPFFGELVRILATR